ncbi:MAG: energy-coupling factor transporter transmembrane component T family protein [Candidatus Limnocylindria bacterium]
MIAVEPLSPDPHAALARAHPLPKIAGALVLMLALFLTVDVVTSATVLAGLLAATPFTGLPRRPLIRRSAPLAVAAVGIALFNTVLAPAPAGETLLILGPVRVTDQSLLGGIAAALRLVAIALSGVLVLATIDPTDLADALVEHLHAPPRFVLGALAAWRLAPIFGQQWWVLGLARRARGLETDRDLLSGLRAFPSRTFGLLVGAIRRGTELALAMDARGFGRRPCRTLARPRPIRARDWAVLAAAFALAAAATATSLLLGAWRPLLGR